MTDMNALRKTMEARGYTTSYFETAEEAVDYLDGKLDGVVIGFGGSVTLRDMGLYERLASHNTALWHWKDATLAQAREAAVYISSVNAIAETGEIINIDGNGNRVSSMIFGPKKVIFVIGVNKIASDFDAALWRARNIAAPKNAQRLNKKTPCAAKADKCYDCKSPDRICNALTVLWYPPTSVQEMELVFVNETLGF